MTNKSEKSPDTKVNQQDKHQAHYLNINRQNGMTRIYSATKIDPKSSTVHFEQLLQQF